MLKLSDILTNGTLRKQWNETTAAGEFEPLPEGEYVARIVGGELTMSRTNATPGYKLTLRVLEGDFKGRQLWHDIWLTAAALPMAKRDLLKLGVTELEQLERQLPQGIRCRVKLALHKDDNGKQFNKVQRFDVVAIDTPEPDAFAPVEECDEEAGDGD